MDLHFEADIPVTFRLVEGNGPIHIGAEHVIGLCVSLFIQRLLKVFCVSFLRATAYML